MRELLRRIYHLIHRRRFDAELAEEMAAHREMAERHGGARLGNELRWREDARDVWGFLWVDRLEQDLRFAIRTMGRSPGFTAAAVLVLTIGIGATVAAFSAFNMVALRDFPVRDPGSIVRFGRHAPNRSAAHLPYPAVAFYRDHTRTLSAVLAQTESRLTVDGVDRPVTAAFVTPDFLDDLGARAEAGRLFGAGDARPEAPPTVVLGHGFWTRRFAANPAIVGTSLRLNGRDATVIGVVERAFSGLAGDTPAMWALLDRHPDFVSGSQLLTSMSGGVAMWGRLAPGVSSQAADAELTALAAMFRQQRPDGAWENERLRSKPGGRPDLAGGQAVFTLISILALLILAVACGNLGSLMLARGASRRREMALRSAIGAGPGRLVRQLFTESLALAILGCAGGLALGSVVLKGILVWTEAPSWLDPTPDWRVVAFAAGTGVASALIFGLTPALQIARQRTPRRVNVGRTLMIGAQVASSCVLLVVAGLLVRAIDRAMSTDPGFDYEHVLVVEPALGEHGYSPARAAAFVRELTERLRDVPGVENVSLTSTPPLGAGRITALLRQDSRTTEVYIHQVDQHYLATLQIPLLRGRNLDPDAEAGIVVSESLARRRWPDREPVGETFTIGDEPLTVVGVAGDARTLALGDSDAVELYRLVRASDLAGVALVVRTSAATDVLAGPLSTVASGLDRNLKPRVQPLKDRFRDRFSDGERVALAVGLLGGIALAVACLGILGLVSYSVAQRTKEIGVRLALGARPRHVLTSLSRQFLGVVIGGLSVGVVGAAWLAQLLRHQLYGLSTIDPIAYAGAVGLFLCTTGLAAFWPARRALRVDPLIVLRHE